MSDGATPATPNQHQVAGIPPCFRWVVEKKKCEACKGIGSFPTEEGKPPIACAAEGCVNGQVPTGEIRRVEGGRHKGEWIWRNGEMTSWCRCMNCGVEWENVL